MLERRTQAWSAPEYQLPRGEGQDDRLLCSARGRASYSRRCGCMAKAAGVFAGVGRVKQGAELAPRTGERFPMKRSWGWILAWIVVVCLLWSLPVEASMNPASSCEKHSVAWSRESRSPSSCQSLRVLSRGLLRGGAGPQQFFLSPDLLLRAEELDPAGPPWLEFRGPPGRYRDLERPVGCRSRRSRPQPKWRGVNYASTPNFRAAGRPNLKSEVLQHALAKAC